MRTPTRRRHRHHHPRQRRLTARCRLQEERVWIPVPPRPNSLVVNLGGELERWSNGRFKATLHCVVNETGRERFSLPFFYEPNLDAQVAPLPSTVSAAVSRTTQAYMYFSF